MTRDLSEAAIEELGAEVMAQQAKGVRIFARGTLTTQIERVTDVLEELKPHFPEHWEEVGLFRDRMPLDPDYPAYLRADAAGEITLATARLDGALVGYVLFFVRPHLHYRRTLTAVMDIIYLAPAQRGDGTGGAMVRHAVEELRRRGVGPAWGGSKNHKGIEWLWRSEGFEPAETMLVRWIGGDHA